MRSIDVEIFKKVLIIEKEFTLIYELIAKKTRKNNLRF